MLDFIKGITCVNVIAEFTKDGLDLSKTNGTDAWRYAAFSGWAPGYYDKNSGHLYERSLQQ